MPIKRGPGVDLNEIDQSFTPEGSVAPGAIVIGRSASGPAFYPTTVRSWDQFRAIFGDNSPAYPATYGVRNYLRNANSLTFVRVLGHADGGTVTSGYTVGSVVGITDTAPGIGATGSILAVLHVSSSLAAVQVSGVVGDANRFTIRIGSSFAATASFLTSSDDYVGKVLNSDPTKYQTYGHYANQIFSYRTPAASASWSVVNSISSSFTSFVRDFDHGVTPWIKSQPLGGIEFDLFRFHTVTDGRSANDLIKVQIANVRPSSAPSVEPYGSFDVIVRDFYDSDARPRELKRFANLNLNPDSPLYILRQIGNQYEEFDTATRKFILRQDGYELKSDLIRVELNSLGDAPAQALPCGFRGFPKQLFSGSNLGNGGANGISFVPDLKYVPDQLDLNGNYNQQISWGVSFVSGGVVDRMRAFPDGMLNGPVSGTDADFSLSNLSGSYVNGQLRYSYQAGFGSHSLIPYSASLYSFTMPFYGGFDGWDLRVNDPTYLNNSDNEGVHGVVCLKRAIDTIANPDQISGEILALPGQHNLRVTDYARELVNTRRDMFYPMDLSGSNVAAVIAGLEARQIDDNYSAAYYPDVIMIDPVTSRRVRVPPSVGVLGSIALNDKIGQAFFAPAGMERGGLTQFGIIDTVDRISPQESGRLYEARINPLKRFPKEGVVVFGQKTLQLRQSALDRVNVRRLLLMAKRHVTEQSIGLVFEGNNSSTWTKFQKRVEPFFDKLRKDAGVSRFRVVMDGDTNTADVIDRNEMFGLIFLEPVKSAEFITIGFTITGNGVSFSE